MLKNKFFTFKTTYEYNYNKKKLKSMAYLDIALE